MTTTLVERIRAYAMPQGPIACHGTWLRQEGEMRSSAEKPWMRFHAEQWFPGNGIDFRWIAWVRMSALIHTRVVDSFEDGKATLKATAFGLVPVARSRGPATDRGEAMRGLAELPWRPFAFGEAPSLTWESAGNGELCVCFDDAHIRAAVRFEVDSAGQVQSAFAPDRPRIVGAVSAGAKIPIVPIENSPRPRRVVLTPTLESRGGPTPVQGERRGRDQRAQARRFEHSENQ